MKKNGYTLIEIMLVVTIIAILGTATMVSFQGIHEKSAIKEAEMQIPLFLQHYVDKSFDSGIRYKMEINFEKKRIFIYEKDGKYLVDELKMNSGLKYTRKNDEEIIIEDDVPLKNGITEDGNFSKGFTILVANRKKDKVFRKITGDNSLVVKYGKIRLYKPTVGEYVNYEKRNNTDVWKLTY